MDKITLGRTGLQVTVMGLGCGGPSRVGKSYGRTQAESAAIVRQALDVGINFVDTAEAYGTEDAVGQAIRGVDRSSLILSTKKRTSGRITPEDVQHSLEESLRRLGTDYVDVYHLHGVAPADYAYLLAEIVPTLERFREQGKLRFIGITEALNSDAGHAMLQRALQDDVWDVMMVGFNLLNQSARDRVFPKAMEKNVGILIMFAVRLALSRPARLAEVMQELVERGQVNPSDVDMDDPLGFLVHEGGAASVTDAAYRFCRYEPGAHVILSGTGNPDHLRSNLQAFSRPPLPDGDVTRARHIFRRVDSVSGQ
jgi:aryl-alcohol dehydrogenase-like predicted oxidoreductase